MLVQIFYNTCIQVSTYLQPDVLLQSLLEIEREMGRSQSDTKAIPIG